MITGAPQGLSTRKKDVDGFFERVYTEIDIECLEMDKYGRVLANIGNCTETLVREGLAHRYFGKTKDEFISDD
jgi:hypothetical protein